MLLDDLYQVIEKLRERMETHQDKLKQSEALTRNALVDPLLRTLGWDIGDSAYFFAKDVAIMTEKAIKFVATVFTTDGNHDRLEYLFEEESNKVQAMMDERKDQREALESRISLEVGEWPLVTYNTSHIVKIVWTIEADDMEPDELRQRLPGLNIPR